MDKQSDLVKAALRTYISNEGDIAAVMAHATPLPNETVSEAPFGTPRQLHDLGVNLRRGCPVVVAPGVAAGFGDLASWVVENKFQGKFRAGNSWDGCTAKSVPWLAKELQKQVSWS